MKLFYCAISFRIVKVQLNRREKENLNILLALLKTENLYNDIRPLQRTKDRKGRTSSQYFISGVSLGFVVEKTQNNLMAVCNFFTFYIFKLKKKINKNVLYKFIHLRSGCKTTWPINKQFVHSHHNQFQTLKHLQYYRDLHLHQLSWFFFLLYYE